MADLWVVLTILVFFGLCVALVRGCDQIIGPDNESDFDEPAPSDLEDATAGAAVR
jgi:hypothetical protein